MHIERGVECASAPSHVFEDFREGLHPTAGSLVRLRSRSSSSGILDGPLVLHRCACALPMFGGDHRHESPRPSTASGSRSAHELSVVLTQPSSQIGRVAVVCVVGRVLHDIAEIAHRAQASRFTSYEGYRVWRRFFVRFVSIRSRKIR